MNADLAELTPAPGDTFVLCSDGLTGHVHDEEIAKIVADETDLDAACAELVDLATEVADGVWVVAVDPPLLGPFDGHVLASVEDTSSP